MSIEAYWYQSYTREGPPKMRRLCRQPLARQWAAAIDLAIAYSAGRAGYRSTGRNSVTGEGTWWWPQPEGDWWLVPYRVERRCFALVRAAARCEVRRGRGIAEAQQITRRLRRWLGNGRWRRVAAAIFPRHGTPTAHPFGPPARRGRKRREESRRRIEELRAKYRTETDTDPARAGTTWSEP